MRKNKQAEITPERLKNLHASLVKSKSKIDAKFGGEPLVPEIIGNAYKAAFATLEEMKPVGDKTIIQK